MFQERLSSTDKARPSFPTGDHRWTLGVQRSEISQFFAPTPQRDAVLAERSRWLADDPIRYARLLPEGVAPLDETIELLNLPSDADDPYERLLAVGRSCEDDLIWLRPTTNGTSIIVGGVVCFPSQWALGDKLGRPLVEVHGPVPQLNEALAGRIDAFLAGFDARFGWRRMNWSLVRDFELNHHPDRRLPKVDATVPPAEIIVRWEHQLLVRLPRSESILFALRTELEPLTELKSDPAATARLAQLLETMPPEIAKYKSLATAREGLIAYLRV